MIAIALVYVAHNDRNTFDKETIAALAVSIDEHGLDNPITVRHASAEHGKLGEYELIAGERRLRACQLLKHSYIRARVIVCGDKTADLMRLEENILREDLTALDKAAGIKRYIDLHGESQTVVGKRFGMSQANVSNLLRLLQLTPFWRDEIRTGKIAHTLVRDVLVPWAHRPGLLDFAAEKYTSLGAHTDEINGQDLQGILCQGIRTLSRSCRQEQYQSWRTYTADDCCFRVSDKNRDGLDIEPDTTGEPRAWNIEAWNALNAPAVKEFKARKAQDKKSASKSDDRPASDPKKNTGKKGKAKAPPAEPTCNLRSLHEALLTQLRGSLAAAINPKKHKSSIMRVALMMAITDSVEEAYLGKGGYNLATAERLEIFKAKPDADFPGWICDVVRSMLLGDDFYCNEVALITGLASMLPHDLMHDWKPNFEILNCYDDTQLVAFAHDHEQDHDQPRQSIIKCLLDKGVWQPGYVPAEVRDLLK